LFTSNGGTPFISQNIDLSFPRLIQRGVRYIATFSYDFYGVQKLETVKNEHFLNNLQQVESK
jgi:hypothetical protein